VEDYFEQARTVTHTGHYYVGLAAALMIPDMCGAMETPPGMKPRKPQPRYVAWFEKNMAAYTSVMKGVDCWNLRNSIIHQGSAFPPKGGFDRYVFTTPGPNVFHCNRFAHGDHTVINLDLVIFVDDMVNAALTWHATAKTTIAYKANFPRFIQSYPGGLPPYIVGQLVIA
jgi:hypothetical protein